MPSSALPRPSDSLPAVPSKARTGLLTCLLFLLILAFLPSCVAMRPAGPVSEKGRGPAPSGGQIRTGRAVPPDRTEGPAPVIHVSQGTGTAIPQELSAASRNPQSAIRQISLSFIPNRGQVDGRVKFYGRSGSAGFFFARDEVVYSFARRKGEASPQRVNRSAPAGDPGLREEPGMAGCAPRLRCREVEQARQGHASTDEGDAPGGGAGRKKRGSRATLRGMG